MNEPKPHVLRPSVWNTDNLGDLIAEGVIDIDDVCAKAIYDEKLQEIRKKTLEDTAFCEDPDWEPPYTIVNTDF